MQIPRCTETSHLFFCDCQAALGCNTLVKAGATPSCCTSSVRTLLICTVSHNDLGFFPHCDAQPTMMYVMKPFISSLRIFHGKSDLMCCEKSFARFLSHTTAHCCVIILVGLIPNQPLYSVTKLGMWPLIGGQWALRLKRETKLGVGGGNKDHILEQVSFKVLIKVQRAGHAGSKTCPHCSLGKYQLALRTTLFSSSTFTELPLCCNINLEGGRDIVRGYRAGGYIIGEPLGLPHNIVKYSLLG